jgi:hypothetical protein
MKKILLFLLLVTAHFAVQAQHYQSIFGRQSTSWEIEWHNLPGYFQANFYVEKDTVVNGLSYKKIKTNNWANKILLREDTITGKVWHKNLFFYSSAFPDLDDTIEILAFDFSLMKGDTMDLRYITGGTHQYPYPLNQVDSVYYVNGLKHIQFRAIPSHAPNERITFIEGVGGNLGVIWKIYRTYMQRQYLLCSYKDGVKTSYVNKKYNGNCNPHNLNGSGENVDLLDQISIYPNPAQEKLFIKTAAGTNVKACQILNVFGKVIAAPEIQTDNAIDIAALSAGIYVLQLHFSNGKVNRQKFVKQQ